MITDVLKLTFGALLTAVAALIGMVDCVGGRMHVQGSNSSSYNYWSVTDLLHVQPKGQDSITGNNQCRQNRTVAAGHQ